MVIRSGFIALQKCVCRMSGGPLLCVVLFMVHTYDGWRCVFVIYCVWGVLCFLWCIHVMLRCVFIIYCVWRVIVFCAFLCYIYVKVAACGDNICVHGGGACGDNICVYGGACVPPHI